MKDEHVVRHEDNKLGKLKSSFGRFSCNLMGQIDSDKHKFVITKTDGSRRVVSCNYIEFDTENKTIELFMSTGHVKGTIMKNIEEVEEL